MEETVHNFADLESFYDRKIAIVRRAAEESVGVYRLAIKLFTKVILRFEHRICTNFGFSEESYGGRNDPLGGLGQGIMLLG